MNSSATGTATAFERMTDEAFWTTLQAIIFTSNSVEEATERLKTETGYPYTACMTVLSPSDNPGQICTCLSRNGLAGLQLADGTMVTVLGYTPTGKAFQK